MEPQAWYDYAEMCTKGQGGKVDLSEAYLYISADAAITHPASGRGEQIWKMRRSIADQMNKDELTKVLSRLDKMFKEKGKPRGFNEGHANPPESVEEGKKLAEKMEMEHRAQIQNK